MKKNESSSNLLSNFLRKSHFRVNNNFDCKKIFLWPGCTLKSYWLLARHGSRNPGDDDIEKMLSRGPELRDLVLKNHEEGKGTSNFK